VGANPSDIETFWVKMALLAISTYRQRDSHNALEGPSKLTKCRTKPSLPENITIEKWPFDRMQQY
jgi:hypothetical protein